MIDKAWQGKGLGKQALQTSIDFVKTMPCGKAEFVWLSYEAEIQLPVPYIMQQAFMKTTSCVTVKP